jgi:SAM-dependent methyltransferase
MDANTLADEIAKYPWYHTLDLGGGVVTKGMFDHRAMVDRYLLPASTEGMRCLDIGTMDGFWAFEMARRGAAEVVALDVEMPHELDWPPAERARTVTTMDETKGTRFELARQALGHADVQRVLRSVYDLDTDLGQFDLVFCGDLICHLRDPILALMRILSVTRGAAIIVTPVERFGFFNRRKPLVRFDGIDAFQWWVWSEPALERAVRAVGFRDLEFAPPFDLPATEGGGWKGRRAVVKARP